MYIQTGIDQAMGDTFGKPFIPTYGVNTFRDLWPNMIFGMSMETDYYLGATSKGSINNESGANALTLPYLPMTSDIDSGGFTGFGRRDGSLDPIAAEAGGCAYTGQALRVSAEGEKQLWVTPVDANSCRDYVLGSVFGPNHWSIVVCANFFGFSGFLPNICSYRGIVDGGAGGSGAQWWFTGQTSGTDLQFVYNSSGPNVIVQFPGVWISPGYHSVVLSAFITGGADFERRYLLYLDGILVSDVLSTTLSGGLGRNNLGLACAAIGTNPGNWAFTGEYVGFYLFDQVFSAEQAFMFHQDPQGMFRQIRPALDEVAPAAPSVRKRWPRVAQRHNLGR